ncbi:MAG: hypothetical protein K2G36_11335 [Ruminococcus sp.]|nr:hypothetical protein [Ruminococcus sp.]
MKITEKEVKETEFKTYAYLSTLVSGIFGALAILNTGSFIFALIEYLTYHNDPDDHGGKLHYVDLTSMWTGGIIGIISAVIMIYVIAYRIRNIRKLENKIPVVIFSGLAEILFIVVWGYVIITLSPYLRR